MNPTLEAALMLILLGFIGGGARAGPGDLGFRAAPCADWRPRAYAL